MAFVNINQIEEKEAEFFEPEANDEIEGVVIAKKEGTYGKFFLVIEEDEGDRWITTQCGSLHRQILKGKVEEGDYVKVVYKGRKNDEFNSHDYELYIWEEDE